MREFIRRALQKTSRMNSEQMQSLLSLITEEYEALDAVLDSLGTGVLVCDSFHILVQNNKAAARILPFEYYEIQERPVWSCIRDSDIAFFIQDAMENKETVIAREFPVEEVSGTRYLSISLMPLVQHKSVRGTIITINDITEKKNDEMKTRRLEGLASLTNLAATVAHEIKNPLGSISIYIQLVRKALAKHGLGEDEQMGKYINVVEEEIDRLNKIVVDFLSAVRPIKFEFAPVVINDLVKSVTELFAEEATRAGVSFILELSDTLPLLRGDERFLRQMLINLIKNAIAATLPEGAIHLKSWSADDQIYLSIRDTGMGIPNEVLNKIFEPYFTTKADGTGLGLTMTYKVVKEHGGDIRVQSESGKGTCFTIKLPVMRRAQQLIEYEENEKR